MNSIWIALSLTVLRINSACGDSNVTFVCNSGHILSGFQFVCDGRIDCYDGSDESTALCSHTFCPIDHFKCYYGACVHRWKKCDGRNDCVDASDEENCGRKLHSCLDTEFSCANTSNDAYTQYCISAQLLCDGFHDCYDGSDESIELCTALECPGCAAGIECPPLLQLRNIVLARIDFKCERNGRPISCSERVLPGTTLTYFCREYYEPASEEHAKNNWNICQQDGTWLRDVLECKPICGRMSEIIPLIANGWQSSKSMPWHSNLYAVDDDGDDAALPSFLCGATLISEVGLITAAHCIWDVKPANIRLALGSAKVQFNESYGSFIRRYAVKQVIIHPLYLDRYGNYASDIALIEIEGFVRFSEYLLPICVDLNLDDITSHLSDQSIGIVVGLGLNENLTYSDSLRVTTMPVVDSRKCAESYSNDFRKYITFTTFCAGWANGTGVCNGDSGAGLIFPMIKIPNRWCLQGIVSLSPRRLSTAFCDPHQYSIFTKVGLYVKWIQHVLDRMHKHHEYYDSDYEVDPI